MGSKKGEMIAQWLEDVSSEKQVEIKLFYKESKKCYRMMMSVSQMWWAGSADRKGSQPKGQHGQGVAGELWQHFNVFRWKE